jgi:hypothetical protein
MFYVHILTHSGRIENTKSKVFRILSPEQEAAFLNKGLSLKEHIYKLQCGQVVFEVNCPEIRKKGNANEDGCLILPEFLIPGRPYPIYVYLYAIMIYSTNLCMGQREAAEITRKRFGLETFSHTTLGRAMKRIEILIKKHERTLQREEELVKAPAAGSGTFPCVDQTKDRREIVASYLKKAGAGDSYPTQEALPARDRPDYKRPPYIGALIDACHRIIEYTFSNYQILLL